jgi:hypothetical protein
VRRVVGLVACALLALPLVAGAQSPGETTPLRVSFVVRGVLSVSVDPDLVDFGEVPVETGDTFRSPTPLTINVRSNAPWTLAGRVSEIIHAHGTGRAADPSSLPTLRLERLAPNAPAFPLPNPGNASAVLISGGDTGPEGAVSRPELFLRVPPGAEPGAYQMRVVLELRGAP